MYTLYDAFTEHPEQFLNWNEFKKGHDLMSRKKGKRMNDLQDLKELVIHSDVVETTTTPDGQKTTKETKTDADVAVQPAQ